MNSNIINILTWFYFNNLILSLHVLFYATAFLAGSDTNTSKVCEEKYHKYTSKKHDSRVYWQNILWKDNKTAMTLNEGKLFWTNIANRLDIPADGQLVTLFDAEHCK